MAPVILTEMSCRPRPHASWPQQCSSWHPFWGPSETLGPRSPSLLPRLLPSQRTLLWAFPAWGRRGTGITSVRLPDRASCAWTELTSAGGWRL